ncbi:MAG: hypothetical protein KGR26_08745, partial [Cyanobacteria bacterium REEB65]|nr:hypothetical protein [Cyanobacteria bacterium REEB65]
AAGSLSSLTDSQGSKTAQTSQETSAVTPTADRTLTGTGASAAQITTDPSLLSHLPANYGGLEMRIHWPTPTRSIQSIPTSANSIWIQVFQGGLSGPTSGGPAPTGILLASRVVAKGKTDPVPGSSSNLSNAIGMAPPPGCCGATPPPGQTNLYLLLPPGNVTVWAGSYAETSSQVSTASVYLTSGQGQATVPASQIASTPLTLNLGGNPATAPTITSVSPTAAGMGSKVTLTGTNFGSDPTQVVVNLVQPASSGCPGGCQPPAPISLTTLSASGSTIVAQLPDSSVVQAPFGATSLQVSVNGINSNSKAFNILNNLSMSFDQNTVKQDWSTTPSGYATAVGAEVVVSSISGNASNPNLSGPLTLTGIPVTVTTPGGATESLDAQNGFAATVPGTYTVTANSGDLSTSLNVTAYNVQATLTVNNPILAISSLTNNAFYPNNTGFTINGTFVNASGQPYPSRTNDLLSSSDFNLVVATGSTGILAITTGQFNNQNITAEGAGIGTIIASLAMAPASTASTTVKVLAPTAIQGLAPINMSTKGTPNNSFASVSPSVLFNCPGSTATTNAGLNSTNATFASDNTTIFTVDQFGNLSPKGDGTATLSVSVNGVTMPDGSSLNLTATTSVTVTN